jgi:hypothetical protein
MRVPKLDWNSLLRGVVDVAEPTMTAPLSKKSGEPRSSTCLPKKS